MEISQAVLIESAARPDCRGIVLRHLPLPPNNMEYVMSKFDGTMTEIKRIEADGINAIVSYYTNGEGASFEPRLRFVIGDSDRPIKGLTKDQALAVRDAFNVICAEWESPARSEKIERKVAVAKKTSDKPSNSNAASAIAELMLLRASSK